MDGWIGRDVFIADPTVLYKWDDYPGHTDIHTHTHLASIQIMKYTL